jgi:outer membrane protein OmpA-like peptidoglycan-associated protein
VLKDVPAGMVIAGASAAGYDDSVTPLDLQAGGAGHSDFQLFKHQEKAADLERAISQKGSVAIYGIHFDTGKATLRPDSAPALDAVLTLINSKPGSKWTIAGHTDNQGAADLNDRLSDARAASVVAWLKAHGVGGRPSDLQRFWHEAADS